MYSSVTANLMTESVEDTIDFYVNKLGFNEVASVPNEETKKLQFVILGKDDIQIMFQEKGNLIEECPQLKTDEIRPCFTLYVKVDNVKELVNELRGKVTFIKDLYHTFYGTNEFAIQDNNGYVITFAE